jgi:hypothetical protein
VARWSKTTKQRKPDPYHVAYKAICAACGDTASVGPDGEPLYTIHRDGFGEGPDVPLCAECGADELPDCPTIWAMIAERQGKCAECGGQVIGGNDCRYCTACGADAPLLAEVARVEGKP